jgi:serine O-acetyltransferase
LSGVEIPPECDIGEGLYIGHHGTIIFPVHGRIGRNCNIGHCVTIGMAGKGERRGAPVIGDRVFIGDMVNILGQISIGSDAVICSGAVVTRNVPPKGVMMGNPAKLVSYEGSFDDVAYDGMETDPERIAALQGALPRVATEP